MNAAPASWPWEQSQREHGAGRVVSIVVGGILVLAFAIVAVVIIVGMVNEGSNDSIYLGKMHASPYGTHDNTDAELVTMAHNVCRAFNEDRTAKQIVESFWGMTDVQRGFLMGAAVSVYCPENWKTMAGEFNAYNGY